MIQGFWIRSKPSYLLADGSGAAADIAELTALATIHKLHYRASARDLNQN
jgi:hypothetical protein